MYLYTPFPDNLLFDSVASLAAAIEFSLSPEGVPPIFDEIFSCRALKLGIERALKSTAAVDGVPFDSEETIAFIWALPMLLKAENYELKRNGIT